MDKSPELWTFVLANLGLFIVTGLLTALCYLTYSRNDRDRAFAIATAGFGLMVLGGLVEPVYIFVVSTNETLDSTEIFLMQGTETILFTLGLGLLFYAITQFRSDTPSGEGEKYDLASDEIVWSDSDQSSD